MFDDGRLVDSAYMIFVLLFLVRSQNWQVMGVIWNLKPLVLTVHHSVPYNLLLSLYLGAPHLAFVYF